MNRNIVSVSSALDKEVAQMPPPNTPINLQDDGSLDEDDFSMWTTVGKHRRGKHPQENSV
jgi:hypothetical protein